MSTNITTTTTSKAKAPNPHNNNSNNSNNSGNNNNYNSYLTIAIKAAYLAGNIIQQASRQLSKIKIDKKGFRDYCSDVDQKSEEAIIDCLKQAYPTHNFLAEESGMNNRGQDSEYTWIIDPLDGTNNFIHNHPQYSVSIALRKHKQIVAGVILDPNRNDLYQATLGGGAYLNEKRLRVSNVTKLDNALIGTGYPSNKLAVIDEYLAIFRKMIMEVGGQRRMGSAALDLAFVARGSLDGFYEFGLKPWDFAAGILLVKEAGGMITDLTGHVDDYWKSGNIVASNNKLLAQLLDITRAHYKQ